MANIHVIKVTENNVAATILHKLGQQGEEALGKAIDTWALLLGIQAEKFEGKPVPIQRYQMELLSKECSITTEFGHWFVDDLNNARQLCAVIGTDSSGDSVIVTSVVEA